jgi:hypothetical protein
MNAIVAETPIEELERDSRSIDAPELAHRARNAYDRLRAFVRRYDPAHAEVLRIVGDQYQRGNLGLRDAATVLGMSTSDLVFELEQDGFARPPSAVTLTEDRREAIYQRLRQQRLARTGPPVLNDDLVDRDVIASERIEGVDARAWIRGR